MGGSLTGIIISLATGAVLGAAYFGGLWLTVRRLPRAVHPGVFSFASLGMRLGLLLGGLLLVTEGQWQGLTAAMVGLLLARAILVRYLGPSRRAEGAP